MATVKMAALIVKQKTLTEEERTYSVPRERDEVARRVIELQAKDTDWMRWDSLIRKLTRAAQNMAVIF